MPSSIDIRGDRVLQFAGQQDDSARGAALVGAPPHLFDLTLWPTLAYVYMLAALRIGDFDRLMLELFAATDRHGFPLRHAFWTENVLHDGAQAGLKVILVVLFGVWLVTLFRTRMAAWRRVLGYVLVAVALSVGVVNLAKRVSDVDCPWDLKEYGGSRQHFGLFESRPAGQPQGRCFPGGHSSSGFALFCLFFAARRAGHRRAILMLLPAVLLGSVFALGQWARGAHFPSHDLTTAYLCWMIAVLTDYWYFRRGPRPA